MAKPLKAHLFLLLIFESVLLSNGSVIRPISAAHRSAAPDLFVPDAMELSEGFDLEATLMLPDLCQADPANLLKAVQAQEKQKLHLYLRPSFGVVNVAHQPTSTICYNRSPQLGNNRLSELRHYKGSRNSD